ncbi:MAG: serine hydrolase [Terriglobales bacterium]
MSPRRITPMLLGSLLAILPVSAQTPLQQHIQAMVAAYPGHVALFAKDLRTGQTITLDADRKVKTASVIKLTLMLEAMKQVQAGKLSLGTKLPLTKANQVEGSGILQFLSPGLELTLHDAITLMITLSDNTATNMIIDAVGLVPTNALVRQLGLHNTYFYKKVFQAPSGPMPADQKQFGLGKTTPREMAELVERIYRCDLGSRPLCLAMITAMREQQDRNMVPRFLGDGNTSDGLPAIADKIGTLDDVRNDVALVYTRSGPVILSIFTYGNKDRSWGNDNQAEILVGHLAQTIVQAWSPAGLAKTITDPLAPAH